MSACCALGSLLKELNMKSWLVVGLAIGAAGTTTAQEAVVLKASRMIDPRRDAPLENAVVVIRGDRIEAAGSASALTVPPGARVIDLSGYSILPGLMDCHVHITGTPGDGGDTQKLKETAAHDAIRGVAHAKITLEAGFTTIRNVGSGNYADAALRDLIEQGVVPGPRMFVATRGLGATGGHADINGWSSDLKLPGTAEIADGVDELRKAVRTQIKNGADLIKVTATGGILSVGDAVTHQQYSIEELEAIVETASMLGVKVAAHAHSPGGMNDAVRAGVASIEHGSLIDDEGIRLMKERGTYLVPTLYTLDFIIQEGASSGVPPYAIDKAKSIAKTQRERLSAAFHAGVKFAYGTDAAVFPHGRNARDFRILVEELDVRPIEAIRMATTSAAELIGIQDRAGTLEPGKWADVIAVAGNPLENIALLEDVPFVMKGGVVYKSP
jgi:imidazolonepropionase-like amidohydrolase